MINNAKSRKSKISISVKVNSEDKNRVTEIFNGLGLNLSTAINIFIKKSIAEGGLPFEVRDPFYSDEAWNEYVNWQAGKIKISN